MAIFYGIDSNYAGSLFSSMNSSKSGSNSLAGLLSEYSSIKTGSYRKLLNAYYGKTGSADKVEKTDKKSISTAKDDTKKLTSVKNAAESLKTSAESLRTSGSKSVFAKESVKAEDGTSKMDYNKDKIYKAVKNFVDDYNGFVEAAADTNTSSIQNNLKNMIAATKSNSSLLKDAGITINSDNTLSIDETAFKNSDMVTAKSLFGSTGSYGYQVGVKASMAEISAASEANKSNTYNSRGSYNYNYTSGDLYNSLF